MSNARVNTVTGPILPGEMGVTLPHEHLVFGYTGWDADQTMGPFDRRKVVETGVKVVNDLKSLGVKTLVEATCADQGRSPEILREIAEQTGLNIICTTGLYNEHEGGVAYWKFRGMLGDAEKEIYELFMKEITVGIRDTGIKAGCIKAASSHGAITEYEKKVFRAAARAQKETGVPIITHTEEGTMGPEQAELLIGEGVDPKRIQIGHMSNSTDMRYQIAVLDKGVFSAFDRMGIEVIAGCPYDREKIPILIGLLGCGYAGQLTLSHDYITAWLGRPLAVAPSSLPFLANWYPTHVLKNIVPTLQKAGVTREQVQTMLVDNPRRLFGGA
ncbi:MAG: phosphotriesterase-related protein [bacterium]